MRRAQRGLAVTGALVLLVLIACACGGGDEENSENAELAEIDAAALLERAALRMDLVESFRFVLTHENGTTEIVRGLHMETAEGEAVGSDRLRAAIRASIGPLDVDIEIRILGDEGWITNPLTGRWEREALSLDSLFDPAKGVTALVRSASDPMVAGLENIGGVAVYRVEGGVESGSLDLLAPAATPGRTLAAVAWVGVADPIVYRLEIRGAASPSENEDILRRLEFSDIDAPLTIEAPR